MVQGSRLLCAIAPSPACTGSASWFRWLLVLQPSRLHPSQQDTSHIGHVTLTLKSHWPGLGHMIVSTGELLRNICFRWPCAQLHTRSSNVREIGGSGN